MCFNKKIVYETRTISFGGTKLKVQIADSFTKMMRGLSGRSRLLANEGMLFVFGSDGRHGFWMLNMKFNIDIIWLDSDGRVVHIWENATPCRSIFSCRTMKPASKGRYVLELRAGTAKRLKIKPLDRFNLANQKKS